jgi:hypothetical protein
MKSLSFCPAFRSACFPFCPEGGDVTSNPYPVLVLYRYICVFYKSHFQFTCELLPRISCNPSLYCNTVTRRSSRVDNGTFGFEVFTAVVLKSIFFLFPIYTGLPRASSACHLLARCFAELFYDPEDRGDTFLRNVGYHSTHYTASYPRRWYSSTEHSSDVVPDHPTHFLKRVYLGSLEHWDSNTSHGTDVRPLFIFYVIFNWITFYHGMMCPKVVDGWDGLQMWRVAANVTYWISSCREPIWGSPLPRGLGGRLCCGM